VLLGMVWCLSRRRRRLRLCWRDSANLLPRKLLQSLGGWPRVGSTYYPREHRMTVHLLRALIDRLLGRRDEFGRTPTQARRERELGRWWTEEGEAFIANAKARRDP